MGSSAVPLRAAGTAGLVEMIRKMRLGLPMGFTVDGPKGPRYQAKTGAVLLAKKTGNPILPFIVEAERRFTIKSWDRLQIPRLYTRKGSAGKADRGRGGRGHSRSGKKADGTAKCPGRDRPHRERMEFG